MKLFKPIQLGPLKLKNRIVFPPILTKYATEEGFVTDPLIAFYKERAKGGASLIIVESAYIEPRGKFTKKMLGINEHRFIPGLEKLTKAIHSCGAKVAIELFHAGRQTSSKICGVQPVAPSELTCPIVGEKPRALSIEEIRSLVDQYSEGAKRAREAGFDAVEFDGGYGHLISQFLSPYTNQRSDAYGRDAHGRIRFIKEIIEETRKKVGRDFPILFRINGDDLLPGGLQLKDTKKIAEELQRSGADALDIVAGMHESRKDFEYFSKHSAIPGSPNAVWAFLSREIKESVSIPVIAGGRINHPHLAEELLQNDQADLIAMGRPLIADPELPQKTESGRIEDIRLCLGCGVCQKRELRTGLASEVTCSVNPEVGREEKLPVEIVHHPKRIVVIGGGVGGMEAARIASLRGHQVTLFEKGDRLGGQVWLSSLHPLKREMSLIIDYLTHQLRSLPVKIHLQTEATPELIRSLQWDGLILAIGAKPIKPNIPGLSGDNVLYAHQVLAGEIPSGEKIVIGGGGLVGAEVADLLGEMRKKVTLVEMLDLVMQDDETLFRAFMLHRMKKVGVDILTQTTVKERIGHHVIVERDGNRMAIEADQFIIAMGYIPDEELFLFLRKEFDSSKIYLIGDSKKPRKIIDAIYEGHLIGTMV